MEGKRVLFVLIVVFAAIYYVARLGIFGMSLSGNMAFEEEQPDAVEAAVAWSFFAIGAAGLVSLVGLWLRMTWGFWGTLAVSGYTVVFDLWALLFVQPSAGAGIVPAAVLLAYVVLARKDLMHGMGAASAAEPGKTP